MLLTLYSAEFLGQIARKNKMLLKKPIRFDSLVPLPGRKALLLQLLQSGRHTKIDSLAPAASLPVTCSLKSIANMMKLWRKQQVHKETNQPAEKFSTDQVQLVITIFHNKLKKCCTNLLDFCCNEERACRTSAAKLCRRWVGIASNWNQQCSVCACVCDSLSTNAIPTYTELH